MKLAEAKHIAIWFENHLSQFCERVAIAGSIRREVADVKDVELVVIPKYDFRDEVVPPKDLFSKETVSRVKINMLFEALGKIPNIIWIKPGTKEIIEWPLKADAKYFRGYIPSKDIKVDIFTATAENWGLQYAIRTGPAEYSHRTLAVKWCKLGFHSVKGMLRKNGHSVAVREETELYHLLKMPFVAPQCRN